MSDAQSRLEAAADRLEIAELMYRYAWAIDKWERALLSDVFADDAEGDFSAMADYVEGDGIARGRATVIAWLRSAIEKFPDVLHFLSNPLVTLKGANAADITTYMHVLHLPMGGIYHCKAMRTAQGWRIHRLRLEERRLEAAADRLESYMKSAAE